MNASRQTCREVAQDRVRWRDWHTGWAEWRRHTDDDDPAHRVLRVCMGCDRVCFQPAAPDDVPLADGAPVDAWVELPRSMRQQLHANWLGPTLSHGLCVPCLVRLYPDYVDDVAHINPDQAIADLAATPAMDVRHDAPIVVILSAFAEIEAIAATYATQGMDDETAWRLALADVVRHLAQDVPPDDLPALVDELQALARVLRDGGTASPSTPSRFRPPLRRR